MITHSVRSVAEAPARAATAGRVGEVSEADGALFQAARPRLFGIAYRVLGDASEADDVVQEAWIRWQGTDRTRVRDAAAFLATTTTRLAINVAQSARARRETHIGPRLVDPVDAAANPSLDAEQGDALESAVRLLLQKLSPAERAAYVLREAFDYPYRHISQVLALSEANARQLVTRARRETHLGLRLVEAVDAAASPSLDAEQSEALDSAVRFLLQKLSPAERAAYVLREAFDYPYRRIAQVLALSEANARQLVTRARLRLCGEHCRPVGAGEHQRLLDAFVAAARTGDLARLEQLLAAGAVVPATCRPVRGGSLVRVAA